MTGEADQLEPLLKRYFGFTSFKPRQREIIQASLEGKDVFALLPTGGGKSLCFQLPALARKGLTVVVSPLIALMKDQVDALQSAGVAATFLNSSISTEESRRRLRGLNQGEYHLLYAAPERLLLPGFLEDLKQWPVKLFAIDEAHCISEWGHDFRPEYRQLVQLRGLFPKIPLMALTATATTRVREDIVRALHLNAPETFVASFNRPNLTYRVSPKAGAYEQVLQVIRERPGESGIIYCQARKTADSLALQLAEDGIRAAPYHAGLQTGERVANQEMFLRDEVKVICATIAFGMGINKPNVRFVIHYDLPKNVESYYQETGRAGRDGLPAECLLLFSAGDRIKYSRFIDEKPDPKEREIAREQLELMVHYAESGSCRRATLLEYFGEAFPEPNCGGCDNCLSPREQWDGTVATQKFLSCIFRVQEKTGFSTGINHIVEILCGADTEKIRKWGHQALSTYGIGKEHSRGEWAAIGRELVRLGYLKQDTAKFSTVELTGQGRSVLKARQKVSLTRPMNAPQPGKPRTGEILCDEALFEELRNLRKRLADEQQLPPYIVFSDVALRQMARFYPTTEQEFSRISGVGEKKLREFGDAFMDAVREFLGSHPRQVFEEDRPVPSVNRSLLTTTVRESLRLFRVGKLVDTIARERALTSGTIYGHLGAALEGGEALRMEQFFDETAQAELRIAFERFGSGNLTGVYEALGEKYSHGQLRLFRAFAQMESVSG